MRITAACPKWPGARAVVENLGALVPGTGGVEVPSAIIDVSEAVDVATTIHGAHWAPKRRVQGAPRMNSISKIVVSRTLDTAEWADTRLLKDDVVEEMTKLSYQPAAR